MSNPTAMFPVARMTQEQVDQLFVPTRYICDALALQTNSVNNIMAKNGKPCLRLGGNFVWNKCDADEVIAKVKAERLANTQAGRPVAWK